MLDHSNGEQRAATVISLHEYRLRSKPWDDEPPRPRPVPARKARHDATLAQVVLADGARDMRFPSCDSIGQHCLRLTGRGGNYGR
jgi:hypothetical protein